MKRLFAIALLLAGPAVRAQNAPTVTARIEPDSIMIGDRFDLTVEVDKDLNVKGRMELQMRGTVNQTRVPITIGGQLKAPSVTVGKRE